MCAQRIDGLELRANLKQPQGPAITMGFELTVAVDALSKTAEGSKNSKMRSTACLRGIDEQDGAALVEEASRHGESEWRVKASASSQVCVAIQHRRAV